MKKFSQEKTNISISALEEDLLTLLVGKPLYGLAIIDAVQEVIGRTIGAGSLYPMLHKMEKKGLVRSWWGDEIPEERRHARRRYYVVTELGEQVLAEIQQRRQRLAQWWPTGKGG